jgi:hypothetical protein
VGRFWRCGVFERVAGSYDPASPCLPFTALRTRAFAVGEKRSRLEKKKRKENTRHVGLVGHERRISEGASA